MAVQRGAGVSSEVASVVVTMPLSEGRKVISSTVSAICCSISDVQRLAERLFRKLFRQSAGYEAECKLRSTLAIVAR